MGEFYCQDTSKTKDERTLNTTNHVMSFPSDLRLLLRLSRLKTSSTPSKPDIPNRCKIFTSTV